MSISTLSSIFTDASENSNASIYFYRSNILHSKISMRSMLRKAAYLASVLKSNYGVNFGDRISICMPNSIEFLIAVAAVWNRGGIVVPLDLKERASYNNSLSQISESKLILTTKGFSSDSNIPIHRFSQYELNESQYTDSRESLSGSAVSIFYTSGTTSGPKGVVLTNNQTIENIISTKKALSLERGYSHSCVLPLCHVNAFHFSFLTSVYADIDLHLNEDFNPLTYIDALQEQRIYTASLVPSLIRILNEDPRDYTELKYPSYFVSAAAALRNQDAVKLYKKYKKMVIQGYGMTEAVNFSLLNPIYTIEEYESFFLKADPLPTGVEIPGNTLFIKDENNKVITEKEKIGRLYIKGKNVSEEYWKNYDQTVETFNNGMLNTGDLAYFSLIKGKRYFYVIGREKELIKRNGVSIYPQELESRIANKVDFEGYAIVGFNNKWSGEEIALVFDNSISKNQLDLLKKIVIEELPRHKQPKEFVAVEDIPKTSTGKIKRLALESSLEKFYEKIYQ